MKHPSEWLLHLSFKRYCGSKKIVEVVVVKKIFLHSMAVHHSALLIIAIAQAYLKLENTDKIIAKASAAQKQSRKYCNWLLASIILDSIISVSGSIQEAAQHVSELSFYVEVD